MKMVPVEFTIRADADPDLFVRAVDAMIAGEDVFANDRGVEFDATGVFCEAVVSARRMDTDEAVGG